MRTLLRLLAETVLYYLAASLLARGRENAPGFVRVFITVLIVAFISSAGTAMVSDIWMSSVLVGVIAFVILWIGLGIGLIRTFIVVMIVMLLRSLMEHAFGAAGLSETINNWTMLGS